MSTRPKRTVKPTEKAIENQNLFAFMSGGTKEGDAPPAGGGSRDPDALPEGAGQTTPPDELPRRENVERVPDEGLNVGDGQASMLRAPTRPRVASARAARAGPNYGSDEDFNSDHVFSGISMRDLSAIVTAMN